jgi:hypothetical protein
VLLASLWHTGGGGDEGATVVESKRSWHRAGGDGEGVLAWQWWRQRGPDVGGDDGVSAAAACAPVTSLAVRQRQRARATKFCEVILGRRQDPNL